MAFDVELIVVEDVMFMYTPPSPAQRSFRENQSDLTFNLGAHLAQSEPITTGIAVGTITGAYVENVMITAGGQGGTYATSITLTAMTTLSDIWIQFDTVDISGGNQTASINFTTTGGP